MKHLIKPIQLRKFKLKPPLCNENQPKLQLVNRKLMNQSIDNRLSCNVSQYINVIRDLSIDNALNSTLQRAMKISKDKSATELSKDISSIRLGFRNAKTKHKPISLTKSENIKMSLLIDLKKEMIKKEAKTDDEEQCRYELKEMKTKLKEIKVKINSITNTINELAKQIEENNINYSISQQINNEIHKMYYSSSSSKQHCPAISNEALLKIKKLKPTDFKEEIEIEKNASLTRINQLKAEEAKHKQVIKDLKEKITKLETDLLDHYHSILYQGIDFRQDGLSEVIALIWNLGQEVNNEFFPTYLDQKSIDYLYEISKMSFDLALYKNKILVKRENESKKVKSNKDIFSTSHSQPKQSKLSKPQSRKTLFTFLYKPLTKETFNFKQLQKTIKEKEKTIYPKIHEVMKDMSNEENQIEQYENDIQKAKDNELERITREFLNNNYEKKYNVCIETMISALFGKSSHDKNTAYYYATKKALEEKIKGCRFYYFFNDFKHKTKVDLNYNMASI